MNSRKKLTTAKTNTWSYCGDCTTQQLPPQLFRTSDILSTTHDNFPLCLWYWILEQTEITLNLMRTSRTYPHLSACHSLCITFNFSRTPLSLPGIKVIARNSTETRESWSTHGESGYCAGPAMNHYWCYMIFVPFTRKIIITDTLQHIEDKSFEVPWKSKEENLDDTMDDLNSMFCSLQHHTNKPRAKSIDKLHELLLKPTKPAEITSPAPRVGMINHNDQLLRVSFTCTDDPPELGEEIKCDENHTSNM